ncbi:hypothetical protein BLX88_18915 [Bacillus obstructivus]|uniref:YhcN/YlaJ family sporulation lipoprotein n=1 Tax=Heyndrickxia oleronia TaxID=38875 RepID=UPI000904340F|nr:hypothetical protein BLX88_18915 [Bacillus obstructivus]
MNKKLIVAPIALFLISGLAGCGQNQDNAGNTQNKSNFQPVGYHTNNAQYIDHDGPMQELMDYTFGREDNIKNNNHLLPSGHPDDYDHHVQSPLTQYDTNFRVVNRDRHLRDINYHGHLNQRNSAAKSSYYTAYEGALAEKVANQAAALKNVSDARAFIYGDKVLVSLVLKDDNNAKQTKVRVKQAVQPTLGNRSLLITSDLGTYYRVRQLDNELRNGGPKDAVKLDAKHLIESQNIERNRE